MTILNTIISGIPVFVLLLEAGTNVNGFTLPSSSSSSSSFVARSVDLEQSRSIWREDQRNRRSRSGRIGSSTGMNMMFDQLSSAITKVSESLGGRSRMTEKSIQVALKDVRRALLDADVNLNVADTLISGVKTRSIGQTVTEGVTADQQFVKAMYDELLVMMGGDPNPSATAASTTAAPAATLARRVEGEGRTVILMAGLQGVGKTTACGKLALYVKEREVDYDAVAEMAEEKAGKLLLSKMPKRERKVLLAAADVYRSARGD